jgi:hypothetical protein
MSRIVKYVRKHYLSDSILYSSGIIQVKSYQFLNFLNEDSSNMEILNKNYIMTEIVQKLYSPKRMGYNSDNLNYIDIKNEEGIYLQVQCPFIGNIAEHFKESGIEISLQFYKAVLNTGIYALILPGTTPQQIYEFLISSFRFNNQSTKNLILLMWKQFGHLLEPNIEWIIKISLEEKKEIMIDNQVVTEIVSDYKNGIDVKLSKYVIKDLRNIILDYILIK